MLFYWAPVSIFGEYQEAIIFFSRYQFHQGLLHHKGPQKIMNENYDGTFLEQSHWLRAENGGPDQDSTTNDTWPIQIIQKG